jgi:hypothetical protein
MYLPGGDHLPELTDEEFKAMSLARGQDPQVVEFWAARRRATIKLGEDLEAKYATRGLKFTVPPSGGMPMQAFGHLDGMRFYFRFRHNWASLKVGPFDAEIERLDFERKVEQAQRKNAEVDAKILAGELKDDDVFARWNVPTRPTQEDEPDFLPTRIVKAYGREGIAGESEYLGDLDPEQAFEIFGDLVENLEDVPEEQQLREIDRIWLYEGLDAMNAYWDEKLGKRA